MLKKMLPQGKHYYSTAYKIAWDLKTERGGRFLHQTLHFSNYEEKNIFLWGLIVYKINV